MLAFERGGSRLRASWVLSLITAAIAMAGAGHGDGALAKPCIRENPDGSFTNHCRGRQGGASDPSTQIKSGQKKQLRPQQPYDAERQRDIDEDGRGLLTR